MSALFRHKLPLFLGSLSLSLGLIGITACPGTPGESNTAPPPGGSTFQAPTLRPIQPAPLPEPDRIISIFFTADVEGHLEPCGCSEDPLGGVDRLSGYLNQARSRPGFKGDILVDAGDLLFEKTSLTIDREAKIDQAGLIIDIWKKLGCTASLVGPRTAPEGGPDLASPPFSSFPWLYANDPARRRLVKEIDGLSIGIFGAAARESGAPAAEDPVAAAREDIQALQSQGATILVALVYEGNKGPGPRLADEIARLGGVHFIIVASGDPENLAKSPDDLSPPKVVGDTVILYPFSQGQSVGEIEIRLIGDDLTLEDGGLPARQKASAEATAKRMEPLLAKIKEAEARGLDYSSLAGAVAKLEKEYEEKAKAAEQTISGSHFVAKITLLGKASPTDDEMGRLKEEFVVKQGEKFKKAAEKEVLPEPEAGKAGFMGAETCKDCHQEEYDFWKKTPHSHAMETLVKERRDGLPECVQCHVAGFRQPGGTTLISRIGELGGVQCENCHGPGSLHVNALGGARETLKAIPSEADCRQCHYPPHTNDFNFEERIKHIVGPGHSFSDKPSSAASTP